MAFNSIWVFGGNPLVLPVISLPRLLQKHVRRSACQFGSFHVGFYSPPPLCPRNGGGSLNRRTGSQTRTCWSLVARATASSFRTSARSSSTTDSLQTRARFAPVSLECLQVQTGRGRRCPCASFLLSSRCQADILAAQKSAQTSWSAHQDVVIDIHFHVSL